MPKKVLIVDNSQFMRLLLKKMLIGTEYVVHEASSGSEAIYLWKSIQPDIATVDISMPEMDGFETIKAIKVLYPGAKIIVCSARNHESTVDDALRAGAVDYLVKPITKEKLLSMLKKIL
ncbi:response regulator [Heliobacillus mobilis]|uniref:Stage 0 sporulation protein A homolog n=1 Tax=Heliobacterium mobile TaxID=28064 RepID=Q0PIG9_HELMO|nr:response regulator [Heliobacterium mobile]ABH04848.1 CheY/Spo0F [Heliobacterium mobile]MTV49782.1 response regulator [Heliobacterium mobile]